MLTKQEMYAFPTACVEIFSESVSHSTFYAHIVQHMRMYKFPVCTLFHQYCAARIAEEDGDPVEWDGIVLTNLIKPLEEKGYEIDSYNYEVLMGFLYDYIAATLEKGDK